MLLQDIANKFRRRLMRKCTPQEKVMKRMLKDLSIKFKFQFIIPSPQSFYIVDFFLPSFRTCLEIDGDYHIYNPFQRIYDEERTQHLNSLGICVIRINNHALESRSTYNNTKKWLKRELEKIKMKQVKLQ